MWLLQRMCILLLVFPTVSLSQSVPTLDEVEDLLKQAQELRMGNRDSSQTLYLHILRISDSLHYPPGQIESRIGLAWVHYIQSEYGLSKKYYNEILAKHLPEVTSKHLIEIYSRLGTMHLNEGALDSARICFIQVEEIQDNVPFELQTNIGTLLSELYFMLGRYAEAEQYALRDYEKFKNGPKPNQAIALYALMQFYLKREDRTSFTRYNDEYLESIDYKNLDSEVLKYHYHSLFNDDLGNRSISRINLLIESAEKSNHHHLVIIGYAVLCEQYMKDENFNAIPPICKKAVLLCDTLNWKEQKVIFLNHWTKAEAELSNWEKAFSLNNQREQINQDIKSEQIQQRIDELQIRFETSEKEKQLQQQQFEIGRKTRQRNVSYFILGTIVLITLGIYFGLRKIIEKNKQLAFQKQRIQEQKIQEMEIRNKIDALDSLLLGEERERKRIANDLHDGLGSLMATTKTHFDLIGRAQNPVLLDPVYLKTRSLIDQSMVEVRRISHNLMPKVLSDYGLEGALLDIGSSLQETEDFEVTLETIGLEKRLDEHTELMVFRIFQELVNNVRKHADATQLFIQLLIKGKNLLLLVEDDGKGFDPPTAIGGDGLGLSGIQSRIAYLNGEITIDSQPGQGTTIMVKIPLHGQES